MHGQIAPGQRLTEALWSERLGVTRGSLREAMSMLLHEGMLTRGTGGGFFVPVMGRRDLEEVQEARIAIEVGALRMIAIKNEAIQNLSQLREVCESMSKMLDDEFELGFTEADRRFHELLVEAGGNERLKKIYQQAPLPLMPSAEGDNEIRRANLQRTLEEHRKIYELLANGKIHEACELLERHLLTCHNLKINT